MGTACSGCAGLPPLAIGGVLDRMNRIDRTNRIRETFVVCDLNRERPGRHDNAGRKRLCFWEGY
jgi:hypothetical protein